MGSEVEMSLSVIDMASRVPRARDDASLQAETDHRFGPSFVDLGLLQTRACQLSFPWRRQEPFPGTYLQEVEEMIRHYVRDVEVSIRQGVVFLSGSDRWGTYSHSFTLKTDWFNK